MLQVEMLPDIAHAPRILPNYAQNIPANLKKVHGSEGRERGRKRGRERVKKGRYSKSMWLFTSE